MERIRLKPRNDQMELRDDMTEKTWNSEKKKDEQLETENFLIMDKLRRKELITWVKEE